MKKSNSNAVPKRKPRLGAPQLVLLPSSESEVRLLLQARHADLEPLRSLPTEEIERQVFLGLLELAGRVCCPRLTRKGSENPAKNLAGMATAAARFLQDLAFSDSVFDVQLAAMARSSWPVVLRLGTKVTGGKRKEVLQDAEWAKEYLRRIKLDQTSSPKFKYLSNPRANMFNKAAEVLVHQLLEWRERAIRASANTPWARRLLSLDSPMTAKNVSDWWAVAKEWADEQWEANPEPFKPLIEACKKRGQSLGGSNHDLFPSEVRARVIDSRLKEAFFSLVKRPDL